MKCVKKEGKILRVTNDTAVKLTSQGWEYCGKSEWKEGKKNAEIKSKG